jgi:hypothetical protein
MGQAGFICFVFPSGRGFGKRRLEHSRPRDSSHAVREAGSTERCLNGLVCNQRKKNASFDIPEA